MSSKENYCYKILNTYGFIVNFQGEHHRNNVPSPIESENFSQWKLRVLGSEVSNVVVYAPYAPGGNKKICKLQAEASAEHLGKTFSLLKKTFVKQKAIEVGVAREETALAFASVPKDTLQDLVDEFHESLEPSVQEFFQNCLASMETDIDTETLVRELLIRYNVAVKRCRELEGKQAG